MKQNNDSRRERKLSSPPRKIKNATFCKEPLFGIQSRRENNTDRRRNKRKNSLSCNCKSHFTVGTLALWVTKPTLLCSYLLITTNFDKLTHSKELSLFSWNKRTCDSLNLGLSYRHLLNPRAVAERQLYIPHLDSKRDWLANHITTWRKDALATKGLWRQGSSNFWGPAVQSAQHPKARLVTRKDQAFLKLASCGRGAWQGQDVFLIFLHRWGGF